MAEKILAGRVPNGFPSALLTLHRRSGPIPLGHTTGWQGGLPIMAEGKVVGSTGVSGGASVQDEQRAQAGVNA